MQCHSGSDSTAPAAARMLHQVGTGGLAGPPACSRRLTSRNHSPRHSDSSGPSESGHWQPPHCCPARLPPRGNSSESAVPPRDGRPSHLNLKGHVIDSLTSNFKFQVAPKSEARSQSSAVVPLSRPAGRRRRSGRQPLASDSPARTRRRDCYTESLREAQPVVLTVAPAPSAARAPDPGRGRRIRPVRFKF
jgi:hypothetical protein